VQNRPKGTKHIIGPSSDQSCWLVFLPTNNMLVQHVILLVPYMHQQYCTIPVQNVCTVTVQNVVEFMNLGGAVGSWLLAVGSWQLAIGCWQFGAVIGKTSYVYISGY
jgi:hypothetical protein